MKKNTQSGFTLIELIMAGTLTAMVLGGAFASLSVVLQAYKAQSGKTNSADVARLIFDRMRTDLSSTFISPHKAVTRFVGMDQQEGEFATDSLTFISTINHPIETGGGTSDQVEVQYYIDLDDSTPERWLIRRFDNTPDNDPFSGGVLALLGPQVCALDFQYFDGTIWWPSWDAVDQIPVAVYVKIGIFEPQQPGDTPAAEVVRYFSTTIWIPCYRQPPADSLGPMGGTASLQGNSSTGDQSSGDSRGQGGSNAGSSGR